LATDTNVRLTIYNTHGVVIRTLELGHQSAGYYVGRDRAAYWDGRNALGEQVASGIYFYQFETDEMSSMRKMVILK
jgi:flagellar hook assembly protein FlgD